MSRQAGQPHLWSRLRRLGRWYAPEWLKRLYRSVRGRRSHTAATSNVTGGSQAVSTKDRRDRIAVFSDDHDQQADHDQEPGLIVITGGIDSDTHATLTAHGPYDMIIDATADPAADRLRRFRRTWFHIAEGGRYCFRGADPSKGDAESESVWQYVTRLIDDRDRIRRTGVEQEHSRAKKEGRAIAESIRRAVHDDGTVTITSARSAMPKLREWETERVLEAKPAIGLVLIKKPGRIFTREHGSGCYLDRHGDRLAEEYRVPEMQLREYGDVLCCPHQVVLSHDIVLPDSFRHFTKSRLGHRYLDDLNPWFARNPCDVSNPKELAGTYFYLSSEVPRHFGHIMTEQLSRMWAWPIAKERYPDLKALLPLPGRYGKLAAFERDVLSAAGVPPEDFVSPKGVLRVERLLSATPMLVNPSFVHPELPEVWRRAGNHLIAQAPERDWPAKVFISRGPNYERRPCHNVAEVEEFVTRRGYTVLYPEDYSVAEQAMIFNRADTIAGFAGSGMFSLIFCAEPKRVILISSESYTSRNEHLITFALGHRVTLVWCSPDTAQPKKGRDLKALVSGFSVDFERDGEFLADALTSDW